MNLIKMLFGSPTHWLSQMENHTEDFEQTKIRTGDDRCRRRTKTKCIKLEAERKKNSSSSSTQVKSVQTHWTFIAFLCSLWWSLGCVFSCSNRASNISWLLIRNRIDSNIYTFTFYEVANGEKCMHELCTCVKRRRRRNAISILFSPTLLLLLCYWFSLLLLAAARNLFVVSTTFLWTFFNLKI